MVRYSGPTRRKSLLERLFNAIDGDKVLLVLTAILLLFSVVIVYSSSAKMAYDIAAIRSTSSFLNSQLLYIGLALICLFVAYHFPLSIYQFLTPIAFAVTLALSGIVSVVGKSINGAARWVQIGPIQLQPSEFVKVATMLFLAYSISRLSKEYKINRLQLTPNLGLLKWIKEPKYCAPWHVGFIRVVCPILAACASVVVAHTSSALIIFTASIIVLYLGRFMLFELFRLFVWGGSVFGVFLMLGLGRSSTFFNRIVVWTEIWQTDRSIVPIENLADTDRAMIAIKNGGAWGLGAGQSIMRADMIHPESDYVFAFLTEEWGLFIAAFLLMAYLWIFFRAINIFQGCRDQFSALSVLGLGAFITLQAIAHIAVSLNLFPETGLTLPIISRGGSALICSVISIGIMLAISRDNTAHFRSMQKS